MTGNIHSRIKKIGVRLAQPDIMFYTLPWLMIILVAGTVAQKQIGLYQAQKIFFSSWILWFEFIPLPGGMLILCLIFINLLAKFLIKSKWTWRQSGTIITHFGILLLFAGAIFTSVTAKEGFLIIPEGQTNDKVLDYHQKVFYVFENEKKIIEIPYQDLTSLKYISSPEIPFQIEIISYCKNCNFINTVPEEITARKELAEKITLTPAPSLKEDEANLAGVTLRLKGTDHQDGIYVSTEAAPHPIYVKQDNKTFRVQFQRAEYQLPFSVTLNDFVKEDHPGTEIARHFHSDIEVTDGDLDWNTRVNMNEPLRYKGYTFFQSSFANTPVGEATILAVVKNSGWLFPYIASAVITIGLLLHLILRLGIKYE